MFSSNWPPNYTVKKNKRSRYVKVKASLRNGIEVVVPNRFNMKEIPVIIESHKEWLLKQLEKLRAQHEATNACPLPHEITLPAINETWRVNYIPSNLNKVSLLSRAQLKEIILLGNIHDRAACLKRLNYWLLQYAKNILPVKLYEMSLRCNLPFRNVTVRNQRSRWGSCSSNKDINLSFKLIFLPPELCNNILIHELCHTKILNHSKGFWDLAARFDAKWVEHNKALRKAERFIPVWVG